MIVVLGPPEFADSVKGAVPAELVLGARDDERLGGAVADAVAAAAGLPLPARACVLAADRVPVEYCTAVRKAGGSLSDTRLVVVGEPPEGMPGAAWDRFIGRLGALPMRSDVPLESALNGKGKAIESAEAATRRPGAPKVAQWREPLRRPRKKGVLPRRRTPLSLELPLSEAELDMLLGDRMRGSGHSVAVISPKGGVGKTLLSFLLGSTFAAANGSRRVVAVDTNPDFGTLADLCDLRVPATISDLLRELPNVDSEEKLDSFLTATETGLRILAAPQSLEEMARLGSQGYEEVHRLLRCFADLVIFDCGTGFRDEITQFALHQAERVLMVCTPLLVTTKIILGAVDHLEQSGFDLDRTTLVVNQVGRNGELDSEKLRDMVGSRVGSILEVPFDRRVQRDTDCGEFSAQRVSRPLRVATKRLAVDIVNRLPRQRQRRIATETAGSQQR